MKVIIQYGPPLNNLKHMTYGTHLDHKSKLRDCSISCTLILIVFVLRCNLAVMLVTDFVVDCVEVDWTVHLPLMLHIIFLGRFSHIRSTNLDFSWKLQVPKYKISQTW